MANICTNTMYVESETRENLDVVIAFFDKEVVYYDCDDGNDCLDIYFDSKWVFPEELMNKLFDKHKKEQEKVEKKEEVKKSDEVILLEEIRDLLKNK